MTDAAATPRRTLEDTELAEFAILLRRAHEQESIVERCNQAPKPLREGEAEP
jgi:hypothetical protein